MPQISIKSLIGGCYRAPFFIFVKFRVMVVYFFRISARDKMGGVVKNVGGERGSRDRDRGVNSMRCFMCQYFVGLYVNGC